VIAGYRDDIVATPANFTASALSAWQINLSWTLFDNNPVLIAFSESSEIGNPVNGENYTPGDVLPGGGTVLHAGSNISYNHIGLMPETTYYYKVWSQLSGNYSDGVTANETTQVSSVPNNTMVSSNTITTGSTECFNASQTITVAGDETNVIVESGASVNFIAGQNIRFLPGFHAQEGSYVHGNITTTNEYCVEAAPALLAAKTTSEKETVTVVNDFREIVDPEIVVYPNPNNGAFTIDFRNFEGETRVMLFNSIGQLVQDEITNQAKLRMSVPSLGSGIFFIKAVNAGKQFSRKIVVQ
jgi:hypothetical protein